LFTFAAKKTIMLKNTFRIVVCLISFVLFFNCKTDPKVAPPPPKKQVVVPKFERDSAYQFIEQQVAFGPRVPNSEGHRAARNYLIEKLKTFGANVTAQDFTAKAYTGTTLNATNIIASFNPDHPRRVLLAAHWDSRHIADYDPDEARQDEPILGADDGGSGVGVLLEVARVIKHHPIDLGVDIVLFDAEDYGESKGEDITSWCLGSQHWAKNLHTPGYKADFGILLDMVGAKNARFTKEEISRAYAPNVLNKIWKLSQDMGYGNYFVNVDTRQIVDDHYFVNDIANIPTIDIINRPSETETGFGHYWHTHADDMSVIDKQTLRAVGQTLLAVIYQKSAGRF